tara:strand:+ start:335 stop:1165 length:831 start_codon:yes stop_codon:yes gene_type:complete
MLKKIFSYYKNHGPFKFFTKSFNFLLHKVFSLKVISTSKINTKIARKIFGKSKLVKSDNGYWYTDPMPSLNDLNEYYGSLYWDSRNGKDSGANTRDLLHYQMLKELVPLSLQKDNCLLNFGAAHGGLSHISWLNGMNVINVEPSDIPAYYEERWKTYSSIDSVPSNSADIIYGSHSVEHVQNIDDFMNDVKRILKPDGIIFFEVPNGKCQTAGPATGEIVIPHTYYFTTSFFDKWFDKIILNKCFDQSQRLGKIQTWSDFENEEGSVIRAIGKINN